MKKLFWGFIIIFFASLVLSPSLAGSLRAQEPIEEDDAEEPAPIERVFPPLSPVESPVPKPTVIQPEAPKEKPEDKIGKELPGLAPVDPPESIFEPQREVQEFPSLAPVTPPEVILQPERQIQQFPLLSPVSPPQDAVEPQRVTQQFPVLSPVTAPAFQDQVQSTLHRFQELSPVIAPTSHNPDNPGQLDYRKQLFANLPQVGIPTNPSEPSYSKQPFSNLSSVGAPRSVYNTFRLSDFSGGLNKRGFPTEIADNEVTELVNFVWEGKKLRPRDGFTTYYDMSEFATSKRIYGLYRYYKQDGSKILLAGASTALYADTNANGSFVFVKTGLQEDKNYYFDTFKDKAIVAHEGDYPFWYDGDTTDFIGIIHSGLVGHQGSCSDPYITVPTKQAFGEDSLVGAIIFFDQGTDDWQGEFITSNKGGGLEWDTIWTNPQAQVSFTDDPYEIYLLWEYQDTIASGTLDDSINWGDWGCDFWVFDASANFPSLCKQKYVLKLTSGAYEGTARFTYCPAPLSYDSTKAIHIAGPESDTVKFRGGPDYAIIKVGFPKARIVKIYKNRVFLIDETKDVIYFSSYNDYNTFGPDNYFAVKTQGGDHITALATFYDDQLGYKDQSKDFLGIFKENSIWKLIWNSATDYYLVQVVEGIGCVAPKSIVNVEGKYLLFLHTTGVYAFDGRTVTPVYLNIQPLLADSINQNEIDMASAGYYDRHYYLSYPAGTSTENNRGIVFNIDLGSWGETDNFVGGLFAQQNAISDTVKLLFADPRAKSFIYQFGKVATDTGQPISLTLKSKVFNLGDLHKSKRFSYFDFDYYLDSDSVKAWFYTDFGDSLRYSAYVNESGGNRHARIPLDADCLGRNLSFKLTANSLFELGSVAFKFREIGE